MGDPIEVLGARFCADSDQIEIVYGMIGAIIWEKIIISDHQNIERTIYKKNSKKEKNENSEINGKVNRITGENSIKKRRLESINESDMTMAERLGLTNGIDDAPKAGSVTMVLQQ